ncbi:MAG: leucine-rich repeat domain-containing protein, partial [Muribaculaceae bacterium]|nr:leucine-rich repeat domain-containing protein [Muribaculaceae bacterium]
MKTLNLALRTILLALAFIGTTTTATAYDFVVNGIYYNKNGDNATVTYMRRYNPSNYSPNWYEYENDNTGDVVIPETVTYNGKTYIVTSIGDYAFYVYSNHESIKGISLPNTITTIGNYAFYQCRDIRSIKIPESVVSIGESAFFYCSGLSNVTIPNSVTTIGKQAFLGCGLSSVIIGNSVSSIGASGIGWANYVTCLAEIPPATSGSFENLDAPLYVPQSSIDLYKTTYEWNYFTDVRGFGENYFSMPDFTTFHGDTIVIPVSMENVDEIT